MPGVTRLVHLRDVIKNIHALESFLITKFRVCLNETMVLCSLEQGTERSTKLAQLLGVTYSLMSRTLALLEKKGLIEREIGKDDKREMYFSLTKNGRDLLTKIVEEYDSRELVRSCKKVG